MHVYVKLVDELFASDGHAVKVCMYSWCTYHDIVSSMHTSNFQKARSRTAFIGT